MLSPPPGRRAVIVAGIRTPFAKAGTALRDASAVDLGQHCTRELLYRAELPGAEVDSIVFGQAIGLPVPGNLAREIALLPQFPRTVPGYTVSRACASGAQAICNATDQIISGHVDVVVAGGVESLSHALAVMPAAGYRRRSNSRHSSSIFGSSRGDGDISGSLLTEPGTGESMGEAAERLAKTHHVSRSAQDELALRSHQRAVAATEDGRIAAEIAPWFGGPGMDRVLTSDTTIRADTSLDALARLAPAFDRRFGTVTAGNASPLCDGASATLMMAEEKARALGYRPLAAIRSYAATAIDPEWQPLIGAAFAAPVALDRAGIAWSELGLIELHEAFAAQVLATVDAWGSNEWCRRHGLDGRVGEVDWTATNVMGGAIALGHPFAASGSRMITTLAHEMARRDVQFGLAAMCTLGGMGFAVVLERVA